MKVMRIKRVSTPSPSPSFSFFSLSPSFFCSLSLLFSLSPMLTFSTLSHTQTLPPLHVITASKDKLERETYIVLKRMLTSKKRRENVPNSLSLSFPHLPLLPSSLLPILSHFFSRHHTHTFGHTPFSRRDVNVSTSIFSADVNRALSSSVLASLVFEAIACTKAQVLCVAALCGWGRKFSLKRIFWE